MADHSILGDDFHLLVFLANREVAMKIYFMGNDAFYDIGDGYLICIGTKKEIAEATLEQIVSMVAEAIAYSQYRGIETIKGRVLH